MCGQDAPAAEENNWISTPPNLDILRRLIDVHNHVGDERDLERAERTISSLQISKFCVMSSTLTSQARTTDVHRDHSSKSISFYGMHPWFVHQISLHSVETLPSKQDHYASLFPSPTDAATLDQLLPTLPDPTSIFTFIDELSHNLESRPLAKLGEIGLDRSFRLPNPHALVLSGSRKYSDLFPPVEHQIAVAEAQIRVALRLNYRAISFHSVRSSHNVVEFFKRMKKEVGKREWNKLKICLHSFGGSDQSAREIQKDHPNVFFSFAMMVSARSHRFPDLVKSIEPHRLMLESDHCHADVVDQSMWDGFVAIRDIRGWSDEECLEVLETNTARFLED